MALSSTPTADNFARSRGHHSAVSWGAVLAGAAAAAALSLILLILGVGLGLSSVSPWAQQGVSAASMGVSTILWLTLTQLLASAMGGYLAGRLRSKWVEAHSDEVYFRDTAHGFLTWAVSSLATAALLTSVIASILGGGVQAGSSVVGSAVHAVPTDYFVDSLFRRDAAAPPAAVPSTGTETAEVGRIFMNSGLSAQFPPEDTRYVAQIVAQRTGLSQPDAEKRVADVYAKAQTKLHDTQVAAQEAADKARKASAYSALWLFISLLIGAFIASLAATFGGRRRDA